LCPDCNTPATIALTGRASEQGQDNGGRALRDRRSITVASLSARGLALIEAATDVGASGMSGVGRPAYCATIASPDRRRLVMGEMTQDAF